MLPNRWVILWNNLPVGTDANSGGYPFKATQPSDVRYWLTKDEAQKYVDTMTQYGTSDTYMSHCKIVEIQFRIMESK